MLVMLQRSAISLLLCLAAVAAPPFIRKQDIFPLNEKHNHASSLLVLPNGDLFVVWYRGSGERTADDVVVMGARKPKGAAAWSAPFLVADTPGFPDTNPTLFLDNKQRVWLFWQAIVANEWHTAITKYRMAEDSRGPGAPKWKESEIMLLKPKNIAEHVGARHPKSGDKYFSRMGWMNRAHPTQLASGRILVPLYSDGYDFSLVAISDDGGATWHSSQPIFGLGGVQPSIVPKKDGTLVAYMRDNGPAPKRVLISTSKDNGETWTDATDSDIPNSGTGLEIILLKDGRWLFINNDTETGRNSLRLMISDDEGKTWKWRRRLEFDPPGPQAGRFHYPSIMQAPDGTIHASYSVFLNNVPKDAPSKTIRHAHFNLEWVEEGDK